MQQLREEIDQIDKEILNLISKRLVLVEKIGKIKKDSKQVIKIKDSKREQDILEHLTKQAKSLKIDEQIIKKIWKVIFQISYDLESK